ncbi:MAG: cytochrome b N-terminal domain-containing protein [Alphaproteobacteria bacterium]
MHQSTYKPTNAFTKWLDARMPIMRLAHDSFVDFPTPKNLNYWWTFGGVLACCLATQIITGIVLAMHYTPHADLAFASVERIRRDVNWGWLIQMIHANGASMFFLAVYIHIFRGLYYGSYKPPRELLWILGVVIYLLMMAASFLGYVLPWGQMSFWGATVITNIFGAIPGIGKGLAEWLWGGYAVDNPTLQRFFSLHYLIPFLIAGVVILHIWALHVPGNNNPIGIDPKGKQDTVPFHPYYTVKDGFVMVLFVMLFSFFVFYAPNAMQHADNYIPANPMQTPPHIVPEWYLLPFYAILRSITFNFLGLEAKFLGVIAMFASIGMLFILPWLDTSKVRSLRYRPLMQWFFWIFLFDCLVLGWVGAQTPDLVVLKMGAFNFDVAAVGLIATTWYFIHFLVITPLVGLIETPKEIPESISQSVLGNAARKKAADAKASALAQQQA